MPVVKEKKSNTRIRKPSQVLQAEKSVPDVLIKPSKKRRLLKAIIFISLVLLGLNFSYFYGKAVFILRGRTVSFKFYVDAPAQKMGKPDFIGIKSIGVNAPIIYVSEESEEEFQSALSLGVVHYPGSALPGQAGNVYIFGHSSDYVWSSGAYKSVFAPLPEAAVGDEVEISDHDGRVYTYSIMEKFVADAKDISLLSQETGGRRILTLQTSWPLGTALKRYIVRAELK